MKTRPVRVEIEYLEKLEKRGFTINEAMKEFLWSAKRLGHEAQLDAIKETIREELQSLKNGY